MADNRQLSEQMEQISPTYPPLLKRNWERICVDRSSQILTFQRNRKIFMSCRENSKIVRHRNLMLNFFPAKRWRHENITAQIWIRNVNLLIFQQFFEKFKYLGPIVSMKSHLSGFGFEAKLQMDSLRKMNYQIHNLTNALELTPLRVGISLQLRLNLCLDIDQNFTPEYMLGSIYWQLLLDDSHAWLNFF